MLIRSKTAKLHRLIRRWPTGAQFKLCSGNPRKDPARGADLRGSWGAVAAVAQEQDAICASGRSGWVALRVFALYPSGADRRSGARKRHLRRYKQGDLRRVVAPTCFTQERALVERRGTGRWAGPTGAGGEPPHLALPPARRRGGLPAKVRFPMDKKHKTIRKGMAYPCLGTERGGHFSRIGPQRTPDPCLEALGRGVPVSCCGQPFEELCLRRLR